MRKQGTEMKRCSSCGRHKHINKFYKRSKDVYRGVCKTCMDKQAKAIITPERREKYNKKSLERAHSKRGKNNLLKRLYGISIDMWQDMFDSQKGRCAICDRHQAELNKSLGVDHCHSTGKVRSLLCDACNRALGMLKEDKTILNRMISYIDEHSK